jgi:acetyltransferase
MWTYTLPSERSVEILNEAGYPLFTGALGCARAMRAMADYRAMRERRRPAADGAPAPVRDRVHAMLAGAGTVLCEWAARPLLAAYGIGATDYGQIVHSAEDLEDAATCVIGKMALKVQSADIPHKTEAGAVALNVTADGVRAAYEQVLASAKRFAPNAHIDGVLVQPMAKPGREVILGVNRDARWGPLLMVGLGGTAVEALGDVALSPVPLDKDDALRLIASLKGAVLLGAYRGAPEADTDGLAELMVRLSHFAADHAHEISEIDLNPVIVHARGEGVALVDALIVKRTLPERHAAAE